MSWAPRKRFGQNFLHDTDIIQDIIQVLHLKHADEVIEIGPGQGALTGPLLQHLSHLTVIEIDRDLADFLKQQYSASQLTLFQEDVLKFDFRQYFKQKGLRQNLRIIGNLPYNISTPCLFHLLESCDIIQDMHFMLQKEVVERLAALPGSKEYGRLSIMVQYYCKVEPVFSVPKEAFSPVPKVESAVVRLIPHQTKPYPVLDMKLFQSLTTQIFSKRRKTLLNAFKPLLTLQDFEALNLDSTLRPEVLSLETLVKITNYIYQNKGRD